MAAVNELGEDQLLHDLRVHQLELEHQNRELREAQNALEESRSRYIDLFDFAPIAYFTFDRHGMIEEVNLTGATLIGRDRAQLLGSPFASLVELAEPARFWAHLRRCEETRLPVVSELAMTVRPGTQLHLQVVSSPVLDAAGRTASFRTALIDVSDRHRAELARNLALESERKMRRDLESLDHIKGVLTSSLATGTMHSLRAMLRIVVEEARTLVDADYAALGFGRATDAGFEDWVESGVCPVAAPRLETSIGYAERVVGTLCLACKRGGAEFSIDDQRNLESLALYVGAAMEIARLGDEAGDAIASRDTLLATVSHDLRSSLSAITMSASLLLKLLPTAEDSLARRQAETISRAADRMARFIDDLLTAASLDAGRLIVARRLEPIEPIIAEAVDLFAILAADAGQLIGVHLPAKLPPVSCDRDRIHQVLANLVGNALKFTPPGGRITVSAIAGDDEVLVSVSDTGAGIAEADRPHVFERYWRTAVPGRRGLGLGLYICKGIVESHNGRIWCEPTPGGGATFTFSLSTADPTLPG